MKILTGHRKAPRPGALAAVAAALAMVAAVPTAAPACPFCSGVQSVSDQVATGDVAVIARLTQDLAPGRGEIGALGETVRFRVSHILKAPAASDAARAAAVKDVEVGAVIETFFVESGKAGQPFLITGNITPLLVWGYPIKLSQAAAEYLVERYPLPRSGPERFRFFYERLEHKDDMIALDAYGEFAEMDFDELTANRNQLDPDELAERLTRKSVDARNKRLYLTMLGVCGEARHAPAVEAMLDAPPSVARMKLDATLACYVSLTGEQGLELIRRRYFDNPTADFGLVTDAINALRFHGDRAHVVARAKVVELFRSLLKKPELADLIIPDLIRWEDWEVVDEIAALFRAADEDSLWVRRPAVEYMARCPLPRAKAYLEEFRESDPEVYRDAMAAVAAPEPAGGVSAARGDARSNDPISSVTSGERGDEAALSEALAARQTRPAAGSAENPERPAPVVPSENATISPLWGLIGVAVVVVALLALRAAAQSRGRGQSEPPRPAGKPHDA